MPSTVTAYATPSAKAPRDLLPHVVLIDVATMA